MFTSILLQEWTDLGIQSNGCFFYIIQTLPFSNSVWNLLVEGPNKVTGFHSSSTLSGKVFIVVACMCELLLSGRRLGLIRAGCWFEIRKLEFIIGF